MLSAVLSKRGLMAIGCGLNAICLALLLGCQHGLSHPANSARSTLFSLVPSSEKTSDPKRPPLETLIESKVPGERLAALKHMATNHEGADGPTRERVSRELAAVLARERNPEIRAAILRTMGHYPSAFSPRVLTAALHDDNPDVRIAACQGWGGQGGDAAIQSLAHVVKSDQELDVRMEAVRVLGQLGRKAGGPSAVEALTPALNDRDPALQYRTMQSLEQITGRSLGYNVQTWRDYLDGKNPPAPSPSIANRLRDLLPLY